jgi:hypothetical protein
MGSRRPELRYVALATTNSTKTVLYTDLPFKKTVISNSFRKSTDRYYLGEKVLIQSRTTHLWNIPQNMWSESSHETAPGKTSCLPGTHPERWCAVALQPHRDGIHQVACPELV